MKSTSRGYKQILLPVLIILSLFFLEVLFPISPGRAEGMEKKHIILIEFSQKGIDESFARDYFDDVKTFFREELGLYPMKLTSLRVDTDGPTHLPVLPADMIFTFRDKLAKGKEYFNNLDFEKGALELKDLIESPYTYQLDGKVLDLANEATLAYAFILFKTGNREDSSKLITRYIYLSGRDEISEQLFPPDFVNFFHDIRKGGRDFTLAVNSTPSGARVFIGQDAVGRTPLVRRMETFGLISLSIKKEGYVDRVLNRVALPGDRLNFDLSLEIDEISQIESDVGRGELESVAVGLEKIGSRMKAHAGIVYVLKGGETPRFIDTVLSVGSRQKGDWAYSIYRERAKREIAFGENDIHHLLTDDLFLRIVPDRERTMALGESLSKKKLTERWWFWAILGAAAAGIVYAVVEERDKPGGTVNVEF